MIKTKTTMAEPPISKAKPGTSQALGSLLQADFLVLWRQRRSVVMSFFLPIIFLISWKGVVNVAGGPFVLASCLTVGLIGIGVLSYPGLVSRDRERGVFQRLRAAPIPSWTIMASRLLVQLCIIWLMSCVILAVGYVLYHISIDVGQIVATLIVSVLVGAIFLALGQAIVGLISAADSVNATARLLSLPLIFVGGLGELGWFGELIKTVVRWSPFGVAQSLLQAAVASAPLDGEWLVVLVVAVVYIALFAGVGIRWFKWRTV